MAHGERHLLHGSEDLSSIIGTHVRSWIWSCTFVIPAILWPSERQRQENGPEACWGASLGYAARQKQQERPSLKTRWKERTDSQELFSALHMYALTLHTHHRYVHTETYRHNSKIKNVSIGIIKVSYQVDMGSCLQSHVGVRNRKSPEQDG